MNDLRQAMDLSSFMGRAEMSVLPEALYPPSAEPAVAATGVPAAQEPFQRGPRWLTRLWL